MGKRFYLFILICLFFYACSPSKKTTTTPPPTPPDRTENKDSTDSILARKNIELERLAHKNKELQKKYGLLLNVSPDSINIKLYSFLDEWLSIPYKWGGTDKYGIDCSAFTQRLFNDVYELQIPRTSIEQVYTDRVERFKSIKYLAEGDILFFRTIEGTVVSHVGFYLRNNRFVAASTKNGVSICNLLDPYWKRRFVTAARVKVNEARKSLNNVTIR